MRAIQGVSNRCDHALDFDTRLSSRTRVQSQQPSLIMVLIARQKSDHPWHKNNKRPGREQDGGGGVRSRKGGGVELGHQWQNFRYLCYATLTAVTLGSHHVTV